MEAPEGTCNEVAPDYVFALVLILFLIELAVHDQVRWRNLLAPVGVHVFLVRALRWIGFSRSEPATNFSWWRGATREWGEPASAGLALVGVRKPG